MKIVIPGGSGQVGQILARHFVERGDEVVILSRRANSALSGRVVLWDGETTGPWIDELTGSDGLINLAGYNVNCRYHQQNKQKMLDSRIQSTRALRQALLKIGEPPPVWLNASTATIYRHALDRDMDEATGELGGDEPGAPEKWNFSIRVAKEWEHEFFSGEMPGVRRVAMRSAMTMSPDKDGVFDVMLSLVRIGLGGTNGSGKQFVSWVHEADFIAAVEFLLERGDVEGVVNITSPNPVPNKEFMKTLRQAWGIRVGLPATSWMMEIGAFFMRTETELVLKSRRVVPGRLLKEGFKFQFPEWEEAANDLCERTRDR